MEKTTQRFRAIASTLAELHAEGLSAQTVNDLRTMYVGAASQHALRMSCVPEHEARTFDTEVTAFWSQLIKRDATSPLFFLPPKLGGLGVGSAVQRHGGSMASLAIGYPNTYHSHPVSRHRYPLHLRATASCPIRATTNHSLTTDEQACPPPQATWPSPSYQHHPEETCHLHPNGVTTNNSLKATPHLQSTLISQSAPHTGAYLLQPNSEAHEAEDLCFRVSVARRLTSPHRAASDRSGVVLEMPQQECRRSDLWQTC